MHSPPVRIVLCRPSHPGNIGAAARAMKVMGLTDLALAAPAQHPSEEATIRASGAVDVLERARVHRDLASAIDDCVWVVGLSARNRHEGPPSMDIADAAREAVRHAASGPVAVVFGNERTGLNNDELTHCHATAWIPTGPELSSLNLAAAVQVASYELLRARQEASGAPEPASTDDPPESRGAIDAYVDRLWSTLAGLQAFREGDPKIEHMRARVRRMLARAQPTKAELRAAHGLVRWIERAVVGIRPRDRR